MSATNKTKKTTDAQALPDVELSNGPFVERHDGAAPTLTANGLAAIEMLAAEGFVQNAIASRIGLSAKQFKTILGAADVDPMTEARAAWESGRSKLESELVRLALASARRGGMIQQLFLLKSQFGHRDQGPATVIEGPRINFTLPASFSESAYLRELNMAGPVDTRDPQRRQIVLGSEAPDAPFGRYADGTAVPDYGQIGRLPAPSNPTTEGGNHVEKSES